ncbi:MAG TPA: SMC family ATPase [Solirubrobacterales bacterium]|nr:SMC family ATPase [Solirubrobacterales bacterium]
MKLHRLEITAFGPYANKVEVDFDLLDESGVYLLTGPTGAGKTSILDAISYALFGEIPRDRKDAKVVSDHRNVETVPRVMLEATIGGERIRIVRIPQHERPKKTGTGLTEQSNSVEVKVHLNGEWQPVSDGWKTGNEELARRIGMTADQFNQVVMLPQGDFERFLKADVKSREELLKRLFPGIDLAWMQDWFKTRALSDRNAREAKMREIADRFEQVRTIAVDLAEGDDDPLPDPAEAGPALAWIETTDAELERRYAYKEKLQRTATEAATAAEEDLKALTDQIGLIEQKLKAEKELTELEGKAAWRKETTSEIEAAGKAAGVRLLADEAREKSEFERSAREAVLGLEVDLAKCPLTEELEDKALDEAEAEFRRQATTIDNFEKEGLPERRELSRKVGELEESLAAIAAEGPDSPRGKAASALEGARDCEEQAMRLLIEIREARTRNMAATLAQELKEGEPCAVCGSLEHPSPAHEEGPKFTMQQEETAQKSAELAATARAEADQEFQRLKVEQAERKVKEETRLKADREHLEKLEAREIKLAAGAASVGERRKALEDAADLIRDLTNARNSVNERSEAAKKATDKAQVEAEAKGFGSTEEAVVAWREEAVVNRLKEDLNQHDKTLAIVTNRLEQLAEVDTSKKIDAGPARTKAAEAGSARDRMTAEAGVARRNLDAFRSVTSTVAGLYGELAPLRKAAAIADELSRMTNSDNERKMKLSIYVLATRLRQVIDVANRHLRRMSDQRYELIYSGDLIGRGATSGLGIDVFDAHTSENRPTSSLSGGESFWASLALALGLAEVVATESGGKSIDTLFIDEGFGTLDPGSLDNVIDVLDSLREGGRSVGLVSHVEEMKLRIPAQIQVTPSPDGSDLAVTTG